MHLTDNEKQTITQAIRDVESGCEAELVTVICQRSDDYYYIPTLWAALVALSFPGILSIVGVSLANEYIWQVGLFFAIALLFQLTPLKLALVPRYIKYERASRYAHHLFMMKGLHLTEKNTGILLFVSLDEQYAEIIADSGIDSKVSSGQWQSIVDGFIASIKQKEIAEAYLTSIKRCGEILLEHYPAKEKSLNELPDHLIEIK